MAGLPMIGRDPFLPSGGTGRLIFISSAIMVFLSVVAIVLSGASLRIAAKWSEQLVETATIRVPADALDDIASIEAFLKVTPGVAGMQVLADEESAALVREWVGDDVDLSEIGLPQLIRLELSSEPLDIPALRAQLAAINSNAVFDDHSRWRGSLGRTVTWLRVLAGFAMFLLLFALGAMIWLTLQTALAANAKVIEVMRQLGAEDGDIRAGFLRRYVGLVALGSLLGVGLGAVVMQLLPLPSTGDAFLSQLKPSWIEWIAILSLPIIAGFGAYIVIRQSVRKAV